MQTIEKALHNPMPFTQGGQTITDRLTAARFSLAGSQLGKSVCKATTEEPIGPKKKHLDYLLHCTHEPNVSIPQLANLLIERTQSQNWAVVYKSLVTIHNLMCYGNERFTQYLASCNANFDLGNFLDKSNVQGYDMSTHVRRYAKYISEKIYTYRLCAFDFCKVKRGREDGLLRTMHADKLLKTLPILQGQVDSLLEFQVTPVELSNGIINSCFILMFRDLIRLFACYNDGIINLLEKYFDMNKKQCKEALDMYKKFLLRMDKVAEFLKVAESVGIDKGEIPDLAKAPNSLLEALEQHLNSLEGKGSLGGSRVTSPTGPGPSSVTQTAIHQLSSMTDRSLVDATSLDETTKQKYLREEQERLELLKQQRQREMEFGVNHASNELSNPFLTNSESGDLIGTLDQPSTNHYAPSRASDDLLSLDSNPFAATIQNAYNQPTHDPTNPFGAPAQSYGGSASPMSGGGNAFNTNFDRAFGGAQQNNSAGLDPLGDLLTPAPTNKSQQSQQGTGGKVLKGNLDESLASLAMNLTIDKGNPGSKPVSWTSGQSRGPAPGVVRPTGMVPMSGGMNMQPGGYGMPYQQQAYGGQMMGGSQGMMPMQQPGYGQPMMMGGGVRSMQPGFVQQQQTQQPLQDPFGGF